MAAAERTGVKRNPFHPFGMFDTASLAGLMFGQTVLVKACQAAKIPLMVNKPIQRYMIPNARQNYSAIWSII